MKTLIEEWTERHTNKNSGPGRRSDEALLCEFKIIDGTEKKKRMI